MRNKNNLNNLKWANDTNGTCIDALSVYERFGAQIHTKDMKIECYFADIKHRLIEKIYKYQNGAILGCVAWLTNPDILDNLSYVNNVSIIVQKEDFLRPDKGFTDSNTWAKKIRGMYDKLSCNLTRHELCFEANMLSVAGDVSVQPIRCAGNHNSSKSPSFPRCHHKFLVFCEIEQSEDLNEFPTFHNWPIYDFGGDLLDVDKFPMIKIKPKAVWTGSFNMSITATNSLENVIWMESLNNNTNPIIEAYLKEHHFVYGLSEPLDWDSKWVSPEYRIGT